MNLTNHPISLEDALYAFAITKPVPDAALLDEFIRLYPEHAAALTDFAIELAVDAARGEGDTVFETISPAVSPTVSRAMSRFQNHLFAVQKAEEATMRSQASSLPVTNPFASLDRDGFRDVANRLHANTVFVQKLRDRQIDPNTMTDGFKQQVAADLKAPLGIVIAHLAAHPQVQAGQYYKADQKPDVGVQQTFEEAVRGSGLTEDQQRYLLSL